MTMTDDALVHDLAGRADLTAPTMSLDPAAVLAAGRRHRHRLVGARVGLVAGLGVVAVAVATAALAPPHVTPPAAVTAELTEGLVVTAANDGEVVESGEGDTLSLTDGAEHHYTVRFDPAAGVVDAFEGGVAGAQGDDEWLGGFGAGADAADEGDGIEQASGLAGDALLVVGYVSGPGDVRLEWSGDGPTLTLDVPAFAVPGAAGRVYVVRIEGAALDGEWPTVAIVHSGKDEHRADVNLGPLQERAQAADGSTLQVAVATDVREADSSAGPVFDLGVPVLNEFARQTVDGREDMTYALWATTWGELTGDATLTEAEAGAQAVTLAGRRSFGALTPMRSSTITGPRDTVDADGHRDTYDGSPVLSAGISTSDGDVLGLLPDRATGVTLVVERATGTERIALPTFTVPGLPGEAAFFFFTLHDDGGEVASAPAHLELAAADGSVTRWSISGAALE